MFDVGASVNSAADWLCSSPAVAAVAGSAVYSSLLLVALLFLLAWALYRPALEGHWARAGRALLYAFALTLGVVFVHYYVSERRMRGSLTQRRVQDVFSGISQQRDGRAGVPVPVELSATGGAAASPRAPFGPAPPKSPRPASPKASEKQAAGPGGHPHAWRDVAAARADNVGAPCEPDEDIFVPRVLPPIAPGGASSSRLGLVGWRAPPAPPAGAAALPGGPGVFVEESAEGPPLRRSARAEGAAA